MTSKNDPQPTRPTPARAFLVLLLLVGTAAVVIFFMGQSTTLACDRLESSLVECTVSHSLLGRLTWKETTLRGVRSAELRVEESTSEGTTTYHYNVLLNTDAQSVALLPNSPTELTGEVEIVARINRFLDDSEAAAFHELYQDTTQFALANLCFGGIIFLIILVIISNVNRWLKKNRQAAFPETAGRPTLAPKVLKPIGPINTYPGVVFLFIVGLLLAITAVGRFQTTPVSGSCTVTRVGVSSFLFLQTSIRHIELRTAENQVILLDRAEYHSNRETAEQRMAQYSLNQSYSCRYDPWFPLPTAPDSEPQTGYSVWLLSAAALFFLGSGGLAFSWLRFRAAMPTPTQEQPFIWHKNRPFMNRVALPGIVLVILVAITLILALRAYPTTTGGAFLLAAVPLALIGYFLQKTIREMIRR